MRILVGSTILFLACCIARADAQDPRTWELSGGYTYVHTNAPPGNCRCFSMNGGSGGAAYRITNHFAIASDVALLYAGNVLGSNRDFTLTSYQAGPRLYLPINTQWAAFAHILAGGVNAGGSELTGTGYSPNAFAATIGGGLDLGINHALTLRLVEADYYLTKFANGTNDRQNNLRLSVGLVFHIGHTRVPRQINLTAH
jgi:peptidoglycan-associated lipoprotein